MTDIEKNALAVYALILVGSILMLIPFGIVPFAGLACLMVGLFSAYFYRMRSKDAQMKSYMTYVIRTVWWSSLILLVGIAIFCSIIVANGDLSMIYNLMAQSEKGIIPSEIDIHAMQYQFLNVNAGLIGIAAIFGLLPYPLYLIYKIAVGARSIIKKGD